MSSTRWSPAEIQALRADLEQLPPSAVLVLDNLHELRSQVAFDELGSLIEHPGLSLRLVLVTRSDPPVPLHRLRLGGHLAEIRTNALAFRTLEARRLLDRQEVHLTTRQLHALLDRTEGWAAGLRLYALSQDPTDADNATDFSGEQRLVADYLTAEVLDRQPPEVQRFLLRTSVAERINGSLADTLTDGTHGRRTLERLAGDNAFVFPVDRGREWYRYHPLLRQMLLDRLAAEDPPLVTELHRRQAIWYGQHNAPVEGVRRASAVRDWDLLGRLLVDLALPRLLSPEAPALVAALQPAAVEAIRQPSLASLICSAAVQFHRHDYTSMDREVGSARQQLASAPADLRIAADIALAVFEAAAARAQGRVNDLVGGGAHALGLLEHAAPPDFLAAPEYRVLVLNGLGIGHLWCGRIREATGYLLAAASDAERLGFELPYLGALAHLALIDAMRGDLQAAVELARRAVGIADRQIRTPGAAHLSLALVHLQRAEWQAAERSIAMGTDASDGESDRSARLALDAAQMRLLVMQGRVNQALAVGARLREEMPAGGAYGDLLNRCVNAAEAEALVASGRPPAALQRLASGGRVDGRAQLCLARARLGAGQSAQAAALARALADDRVLDLETSVEARVVLAQIADRGRHDNAAVEALTEALALAAPQRIRRPFLILGDRLVALVHRQQQLVGDNRDFVDDLLAHLAPGDGPARSPLLESLTDRELIVLRYLPTMRSNSEIGADLYVTVNTVKAHLKSLYRKLGVASRRDAVQRARALGLL